MRRRSRRYLAFRILTDTSLSSEKLSRQIDQSMRKLFGEIGTLQAHVRLTRYNPTNMIGILRCSATWVERVRAALALTTNMEGSRCAFHVLKSSGSIASLNRVIDLSDTRKGEN